MKGNPIDELFLKGLASHKMPPPADTWAKLENQLPQKKKRGVYFWMGIAASTMLLAAMGWLALTNTGKEPSGQELAQQATEQTGPANNMPPKTQATQPQTLAKRDKLPDATNPPVKIPTLVNAKQLDQTALAETQATLPVNLADVNLAELSIEPISPTTLQTPVLFVSNRRARSLSINEDALLEQLIISPAEMEAIENESKKKPGFLNSIVSVARSVNNGKKAISEIRKSKNEFVSNELKYGLKTEGEDEDIDEHPPLKQ
jgi:hypothetical protein